MYGSILSYHHLIVCVSLNKDPSVYVGTTQIPRNVTVWYVRLGVNREQTSQS